MEKKRYTIKTTCPQCGCSAVSHLSHEEIKEKFGDVPNKYQTEMKTACPEWDKECRMEQ
ncbi:MAG: hypothetical protein JRF21_11205 [Deltaproteobacteria bacterium]|nr:hypothetical protein [Deltaproteobacteria bacterium]